MAKAPTKISVETLNNDDATRKNNSLYHYCTLAGSDYYSFSRAYGGYRRAGEGVFGGGGDVARRFTAIFLQPLQIFHLQ